MALRHLALIVTHLAYAIAAAIMLIELFRLRGPLKRFLVRLGRARQMPQGRRR